jgi:hypothetical protein
MLFYLFIIIDNKTNNMIKLESKGIYDNKYYKYKW